jgi:hypothetical protein
MASYFERILSLSLVACRARRHNKSLGGARMSCFSLCCSSQGACRRPYRSIPALQATFYLDEEGRYGDQSNHQRRKTPARRVKLCCACCGGGLSQRSLWQRYRETGASAVLIDGRLVNTDVLLAAQAGSHTRKRLRSLSQGLNLPIQQAFIAPAIQSRSLPGHGSGGQPVQNPNPSEAEVRDALSGISTGRPAMSNRCRPLEAAAMLRNEEPAR